MDRGPVGWDEFNRRHVTQDHPERAISVTDVEEALTDEHRLEDTVVRPDGTYGVAIGRTAAGRLLYIANVRRDGGDGRRYPVHARQASRQLARRYGSNEREEREQHNG
jgi:hypothetical protein